VLRLFSRIEYEAFDEDNPDQRALKREEERLLLILLAGYLFAAMVDLLVALVNAGAALAIKPLLDVALTKGGVAVAFGLHPSSLYLVMGLLSACIHAVSVKQAVVFLHGSAQVLYLPIVSRVCFVVD